MTPTARKHLSWTMQNPANLAVTGKAEELAVLIYRVTAQFPREEVYGLTAQTRRAAISIGSNISEGCGRASDAELLKFLPYSLGSAHELAFQLRVVARLKLANSTDLASASDGTRELERMLSRLIVGRKRRR